MTGPMEGDKSKENLVLERQSVFMKVPSLSRRASEISSLECI